MKSPAWNWRVSILGQSSGPSGETLGPPSVCRGAIGIKGTHANSGTSGKFPLRPGAFVDERAHPEQGFRACLGIIRLARSYGHERLDAAAMRAIDIGARTYGSVKSILANNLDRRPSPKRSADDAPILHPNIRGPRYYN
jgi:transposase